MKVLVVTTVGMEGRRDSRLPVWMVSPLVSGLDCSTAVAVPADSALSGSSLMGSKVRRLKGFLLIRPAKGEASMPRLGLEAGRGTGGGAAWLAADTAPSNQTGRRALPFSLPRSPTCKPDPRLVCRV